MTLLNEPSIIHAPRRHTPERRFSRREALRRASLLGLSATALAGFTATTPARGAASQESQPVRGGVVRVGVPGSAASFDPTVETIFEALWVMEHVYKPDPGHPADGARAGASAGLGIKRDRRSVDGHPARRGEVPRWQLFHQRGCRRHLRTLPQP